MGYGNEMKWRGKDKGAWGGNHGGYEVGERVIPSIYAWCISTLGRGARCLVLLQLIDM